MNKGTILALGKWIGFLGSDDFYEVDGLENLFFTIVKEINCDIVFGDTRVLYNEKVLYISKTSEDESLLKKKFIYVHPDSLTKLALFKRIGLFDTSLNIVGDYEFILRVYFRGAKFRKVSKVVLNFRVLGHSFTNCKRNFSENLLLHKKYNLNLVFLFIIIFQYIKCEIKKTLARWPLILRFLYKITKIK